MPSCPSICLQKPTLLPLCNRFEELKCTICSNIGRNIRDGCFIHRMLPLMWLFIEPSSLPLPSPPLFVSCFHSLSVFLSHSFFICFHLILSLFCSSPAGGLSFSFNKQFTFDKTIFCLLSAFSFILSSPLPPFSDCLHYHQLYVRAFYLPLSFSLLFSLWDRYISWKGALLRMYLPWGIYLMKKSAFYPSEALHNKCRLQFYIIKIAMHFFSFFNMSASTLQKESSMQHSLSSCMHFKWNKTYISFYLIQIRVLIIQTFLNPSVQPWVSPTICAMANRMQSQSKQKLASF